MTIPSQKETYCAGCCKNENYLDSRTEEERANQLNSTTTSSESVKSWETLRVGYEEVQMVHSSIENVYPEAYRLARKFHELYEQQAPFFGYITNPNSREFYPNSNNARLMAYVCHGIVKEEINSLLQSLLNEAPKDKKVLRGLELMENSENVMEMIANGGFNSCNSEWRALIKSKIEEK